MLLSKVLFVFNRFKICIVFFLCLEVLEIVYIVIWDWVDDL